MTEEILSAVDGQLFAVWFLIGAALVFWMQAGFAMVETGFTRAKNAGNILMKNLMDFCIGTVVFILIGFGLLLGEDVVGLIGKLPMRILIIQSLYLIWCSVLPQLPSYPALWQREPSSYPIVFIPV